MIESSAGELKGDKPSVQNNFWTRVEAMETLSTLIKYLEERTTAQRFREYDSDRTRVAYIRAMVSALSVYAIFMRDYDLEDLKQRVTALEGRQLT